MKELLFILVLIAFPGVCPAGSNYQARVGTSFNAGAKPISGNRLNWFATCEFGFYLNVQPVEGNELGFTGRVNLHADPIRYRTGSGQWFAIYQRNLSFDGLIVFPTQKEFVRILIGIGLEYCLEPSIGYGSSTNANSSNNGRVDLDSGMHLLNEYRRQILPSVSAGISYQPLRNKKFSTYFMIKQNLLPLFTEAVSIPYRSGGQYEIATISYRPTYVKVGVSYDLW